MEATYNGETNYSWQLFWEFCFKETWRQQHLLHQRELLDAFHALEEVQGRETGFGHEQVLSAVPAAAPAVAARAADRVLTVAAAAAGTDWNTGMRSSAGLPVARFLEKDFNRLKQNTRTDS